MVIFADTEKKKEKTILYCSARVSCTGPDGKGKGEGGMMDEYK